MKTRRDLLVVLGAACLGPRVAFGQAKKPPILIGLLSSSTSTGRGVAAFKDGMAKLGWKDGADYLLVAHWAEGRIERLPALAEELAARKPAVIVAAVGATAAAAKAAPTIPVVQALGRSPVEAGLAASLARPGGMVTGVTNIATELSEKYLELLLGAVPTLKRIGFLVDVNSNYAAFIKHARRGVEHFRVEARFAEVRGAEDLDGALALLVKEGIQGLVVSPSTGLLITERELIVKFALAQRWPVVAGPNIFAEAGALLSYSGNSAAHYRRAAYYVDRILKGAKPGDLPIEQPMLFELVLNMKTAKALGLTMPPEIMVRVDRIIE